MQQNLDNFSFAEKPLQKRKFFQHEAESTLKSKFCATGSAKDTEIWWFEPEWIAGLGSGNKTMGILIFVTSYMAS